MRPCKNFFAPHTARSSPCISFSYSIFIFNEAFFCTDFADNFKSARFSLSVLVAFCTDFAAFFKSARFSSSVLVAFFIRLLWKNFSQNSSLKAA